MEIKITNKDSGENANLDASEYLRKSNIDPANLNENPILASLLAPVARILVAIFSLYTTLLFYYHQIVYAFFRRFVYGNRTPQLIRRDVSELTKLPAHVAFVLDLPLSGNVEPLLEQAMECASWCYGAGSPQMTIYERTGSLKKVPLASLAEMVSSSLSRYFDSSEEAPVVSVRCGSLVATKAGSQSLPSMDTKASLAITIASEEDGRPMLVKLAREYSGSIADGELKQSDITVPKIHETLRERVGDEPDLLVTFGSHLDFEGFSPWLLRLTELFSLADNNGFFHYLVFIRALQQFAKVKVNLGA